MSKIILFLTKLKVMLLSQGSFSQKVGGYFQSEH